MTGTVAVGFESGAREEAGEFMRRPQSRFDYAGLGRADKGAVKRFLAGDVEGADDAPGAIGEQAADLLSRDACRQPLWPPGAVGAKYLDTGRIVDRRRGRAATG